MMEPIAIIAALLALLGAAVIWWRLLRDRRPFAVRATAHFTDLEAALSGLFRAAEIEGEVRLEKDGA